MSLGGNLGNKKELYYKNRKRYHVENLHRNLFVKHLLLDGDKTLKVLGIWSSDFLTSLESQGARSIQPKFQPVRPGKVVHLNRWTNLVPWTFLGKSPGDEVEGKPVFSKLFRLDRTDPLSFGPKFWLNWSRPLRIKMDEMIFDFAMAGAGCKRIKDVLYKTLRLSPVNQQSETNWVHTTYYKLKL